MKTMAKVKLAGKAETLQGVRPHLQSAVVLPQVCFFVADWQRDKNDVLARLQAEDWSKSGPLIVRSSAAQEDGQDRSMAGQFVSVPDVVLADDGVALGFQDAGDAVADDGGAQVADVHFFGDVGAGVVDDDVLRWIGLRDAEAVVLIGGVATYGYQFLERSDQEATLADIFQTRTIHVPGKGCGWQRAGRYTVLCKFITHKVVAMKLVVTKP